jgi:chaperone required for assembly of F1-ATPase
MGRLPNQAFEEIIAAVKASCGRCKAKPVHVLSVHQGSQYCVAMTKKEAEAWISSQPYDVINDLIIYVDTDVYCWRMKDERQLLEGDLCIL